jgi:hypothetical protein
LKDSVFFCLSYYAPGQRLGGGAAVGGPTQNLEKAILIQKSTSK